METFLDTAGGEGDAQKAARLKDTITNVYQKFSTNLIMNSEWSHAALQEIIRQNYSIVKFFS